MGDKGVSFHFSESNTSSTFSPLDRLSRDGIDRSRRPHLEFIVYHVSETLVVDDTQVDVRCELLSGDARVHRFVAPVVVTRGDELFTKVINGGVLFIEPGEM